MGNCAGLPKELTRGYAATVTESLKVVPIRPPLTQAQLDELDRAEVKAA